MNSSGFTIRIKDIDKVYGLIADLKRIDQDKAVKFGLRRGANVFRKISRKNLASRNNEHTGNLMGSFVVKVSRKGLTAYSGFNRSSKVSEKQGIPQGNHAHLVDRGTKPRYTKRGYYRGIMPASYFHTDARNEGEAEAASAIWDGVVTMAEKLKSKYYS